MISLESFRRRADVDLEELDASCARALLGFRSPVATSDHFLNTPSEPTSTRWPTADLLSSRRDHTAHRRAGCSLRLFRLPLKYCCSRTEIASLVEMALGAWRRPHGTLQMAVRAGDIFVIGVRSHFSRTRAIRLSAVASRWREPRASWPADLSRYPGNIHRTL